LDDGICQCPEVLLREVERLRAIEAHRIDWDEVERAAEEADPGHLLRVNRDLRKRLEVAIERAGHVPGLSATVDEQRWLVRSLRAKLMRERANTHEWVASMVDDGYIAATEQTEAKSRSYHARARRLRAEADRIERGK
jgi:hypothetical protein